jgi:tetratricopeptide (TPR) repeat protein
MIQRGDNLSISVELIDVANNKTLWGEQYERKMSDLLATQREIATAIADKLQVRLSGDDAKGVTKKYTNSNEAYQLYLKGRHFWSRRTSENIVKAIEHLKAATDLDPNFALAYVGLADCYIVAPQYSGMRSTESVPKARAYALKALEIDESIAEAHVSLGAVYDQSWQWAESEKSYKRALELNPNYATAHHWYSIYLRHQGRSDEALDHIRRAQELDPLSLAITAALGQALYHKGDANGAVEQFKKAVELDPSNPIGYMQLGAQLLLAGRVDEAEPLVKKAIETSNRSIESLRLLGIARAVGGKPGEAKAVIDEMEARRARGEATGTQIAVVYSVLGDNDKAFEVLEEDFKKNQGEMANTLFFPEYRSIRADPRFNELLVRMGLPRLK